MSNEIEIKCLHCGHYLCTKIIPENRKDKEFGGMKIPCQHCNTVNLIGVKHNPPPTQSFGERRNYYKKAG